MKKISKVKSAGLKSSFAVQDKIVLTSFGKGNKAIVESIIENNLVQTIADEPSLTVKLNEKPNKISIEGRAKIKSFSDSPLINEVGVGNDMIGCKNILETRFFGKNFEDNIHIQLVYNVLDIEKIFSQYINNIVYALDNLRRTKNDEYDDFVGYMSTRNNYQTFCNPELYLDKDNAKKAIESITKQKAIFDEYLQNKRLEYFGNAFYIYERKGRKIVSKQRDAETIYTILAILGSTRQYCMHDQNSTRNWLYNIEKDANLGKQICSVLDNFYADKIGDIDNGFVANNSTTNFPILFKVFGIGQDINKQKALVCEFYDFVVRKSYKNLGFSIKTVREQMLTNPKLAVIKDKKYDSVRSKMYQLLDYIVCSYYSVDEKRLNNLVNKLRSCLSEEEKANIYIDEAVTLYGQIKDKIQSLINEIDKIKDKKIIAISKDMEAVYQREIDKIKISKADVHYFSKYVYLLTMFLDGKEINDLLTTLINKFDNIASFIDVMQSEHIDYEFVEDYKLFNDSNKIVEELKTINSFARMTSPTESAKLIMFEEAAELLGTNFTREELEKHLNFDENCLRKLPNGKPDHNFRNFIINNVIESSRFKYLIRYGSPIKLRQLADSKYAIRFVLSTIGKRLPQQIDRYYVSCGGRNEDRLEAKVDFLTDLITGLSFDKFEKVNNRVNAEQNIDKAQKQASISLYLTVLYLITKNLVNINSRYSLAFHCLERDSQLKQSKAGFKGENYCDLTIDSVNLRREKAESDLKEIIAKKESEGKFVHGCYRKKYYERLRICEYLNENISHIDDITIREFRNCVAHLGAVRNAGSFICDCKHFNSYYELYHFLIQKSLLAKYNHGQENMYDNLTKNAFVLEYYNELANFGEYRKDFVKALCVPFGYNLPRFKNLSIKELFDKNEMIEVDNGINNDKPIERDEMKGEYSKRKSVGPKAGNPNQQKKFEKTHYERNSGSSGFSIADILANQQKR